MSGSGPRLGQFLRDTVVYGIGTLAVKATSVVLIPLYAAKLSPSDFGLLAVCEAYRGVLMVAGGLGLPSAVGYFVGRQKMDVRAVLGTALVGATIASVPLALLVSAAKTPLSAALLGGADNAYAVPLFAALFPLEILHNTCLVSLRFQRRSVLFSIFNWIETTVTLVLTVWWVGFAGRGVAGAMGALIAAQSCVVALDLALFGLAALPHFRLTLLGPMLRYGAPQILSKLSQQIFGSADRALLEHFVGLEGVALYTLASKVPGIVNALLTPLQTAYTPHLFETPPEDERGIGRAAACYAGFVVALAVPLTLLAQEAVQALGAGRYAGATPLVAWLMIGMVLRAGYDVLGFGPAYRARLELAAGTAVFGAVVNLGLNAWLIPAYGPEGAALARVFGNWLLLLAAAWVTARLMGFGQRTAGLLLNLSSVLIALLAMSHAVEWPLGWRIALLLALLAGSFRLAARRGWVAEVRAWRAARHNARAVALEDA